MKSVIVASAAFLTVLTISGLLSARDASSEASEPVPTTIAPVTGLSDTAIDLNLKAPMDGLRFILFRDIPPDVKFSHGFRVKNSWIASIRDLDKLQLIPAPGFVGPLAFAVLFQRDNLAGTAAQGLLIVEVNPRSAVAASNGREFPTGLVAGTPLARDHDVKVSPKPPAVSSGEEKEELARGAGLMRLGDIATARLIYQNLATRGSASGARALAETYDPAYLKDFVIAGLRPDIEAAKKWYKIAADQGDSKSATRLSVLNQR